MPLLGQFVALWKQLGLNQKISLVLAAGFAGAVMTGVLLWSSRPDMQLLYGRLDPADAADIVAALDADGVRYEVGGGGTTIHVARADVHRVRMNLASQGLPSGGSVGFEIFDRGNFGISDFVQRTNYLRAIQGELARTISQLDGVRSARVMVVMPENRLLVTDATRHSTASVLVETGGGQLQTEAVNSIRNLVANAVDGLKVDDVVVVDNSGNVLSAGLQQDNTGAGLTSSQMRYRKDLEDYFSGKVESMLSTVLGPGHAVVRVSVDVDTTSSTRTEEIYDPDGQVLRSSTVTEDSNVSSERRDAVAAGATASTTTGGAGGDDPVNSAQQVRKSKTEEYEIGRSTVSTVRNAGEIRRISAAVFVGARATGEGDARTIQPRTEEEIESLRQVVVAALGVVPERGQSLEQVVTVQEVDMAPPPQLVPEDGMGTELPLTTWFNLGQKVLVLLIALFAFFYFVRVLKRSQAEAISLEVINGRDGSRSVGELQGDVTPELLNELIRQKPDNVGLTLKEWMSAEQR